MVAMDDDIYARLVSIKADGKDGTALPLRTTDLYLIGRGLSDDIKILDASIRPKHCSIDFIEGVGPRLTPSPSSDVFVNEERLDGQIILSNGDKIQLGRKTLRIDVRKLLLERKAAIVVPKPQLVDLVSPPRINKVQVRPKTKNKSLMMAVTKPPVGKTTKLISKIKESPVKRQLFDDENSHHGDEKGNVRTTRARRQKVINFG